MDSSPSPTDESAPAPTRAETLGRLVRENPDLCFLFDLLPQSLYIKDRESRFLMANKTVARRLGRLHPDALLGHSDADFLQNRFASAFRSDEQQIFDTGKPLINKIEHDLDPKTGHKRWRIVCKVPITEGDGRVVGIMGMGTDITEIENLRSQNNELRELIDLLPQTIYVKDRESRLVVFNRAQAEMLTGDPGADLTGRTDADFFPPSLAAKFRHDELEVMRSRQPIINMVEEGRHFRTRQRQWLLTTKIPLIDDAGEVTGIIGIGADITEQKVREEALHLQAAALDAAGNAILITDAKGSIQWANKAFLTQCGYDPAELIGGNPRILNSGLHDDAFFRELWETILAGKVWSGEITNRRKDGRLTVAQTTISPLLDAEGAPTHFIAIKQDLSKRKELEAELRRINAAIENADDAVILADPDGRITYVNRSFYKVFGAHAAEIVSLPLSELLSESDAPLPHAPPDDPEDWWRQSRDVNRTFPGPQGQPLPVKIRVSPIRGEEGRSLGFACFVYDLSDEQRRAHERKLMEVRLRQAQKLESIGQLAAGVAHEINTPTQFVGDNIHFLRECVTQLLEIASAFEAATRDGQPPSPEACGQIQELIAAADLEYLREEVPAALKQATEGVERIAEIVKAMKEFSHPGTKDRKLVNLNDALSKAATVSRNEWKYHSEIHFELEENLTPVLCLPGEMNQVFLNIIVNAAHAIAELVARKERAQGRITISTRQCPGAVEIRIADNGTGIPPEIQDRIFDPFFTTKEVGKGTGQGLAIAYDVVVHKHKGQLHCESTPGEGTTFIIRLPQGQID